MITYEQLAAIGFSWHYGFKCYIKKMGDYDDYWLGVESTHSHALNVWLVLDEDALIDKTISKHEELLAAIAEAQALIDRRKEQAECEDMDDLTESLGMGRLFGTAK